MITALYSDLSDSGNASFNLLHRKIEITSTIQVIK
jgi:hypothetical protein